MSSIRSVVWSWRGAISAVIASFPFAAVLVTVYRFPIPFVGYVTGFQEIGPTMFAVLFYGICPPCVFLLLGLLGGFSGWIVNFLGVPEKIRNPMCVLLGCIVAFLGMGVLAILDLVIGPW